MLQGLFHDWMPSLHIAKRLSGWLALALSYSLVVEFLVQVMGVTPWPLGNEVGAILSVAMGFLLSFRINSANQRWWEARQLWGQLINESRNFALKARIHAALDTAEYQQFTRFLIGFAHALRLQLRGTPGVQRVPGFEKEATSFPHAPGYMAGQLHRLVDRWNRTGKLHDSVWLLDTHARALLDVCGGCERIRSTPLASSYRALIRAAIAVYVLTSPWFVTLEMGWWGLPTLALGFGFLFGMELAAEEIEEPFGHEGDDLPLDSYCRTIETFVRADLEEATTITPH